MDSRTAGRKGECVSVYVCVCCGTAKQISTDMHSQKEKSLCLACRNLVDEAALRHGGKVTVILDWTCTYPL